MNRRGFFGGFSGLIAALPVIWRLAPVRPEPKLKFHADVFNMSAARLPIPPPIDDWYAIYGNGTLKVGETVRIKKPVRMVIKDGTRFPL